MSVVGCGGGGGGGGGAGESGPSTSSSFPSLGAEAGVDAGTQVGTQAGAQAGVGAAPELVAGGNSTSPQSSAPMLADCEMFPANAIFNTRIDDPARFPVHANSSHWINVAGRDLSFQTDWGINENQADYGSYWGMPINIVDGTSATTDWPVVSFDFRPSGAIGDIGYPDKSDCAVSDGNGGFQISRSCGAIPPDQRRFPMPHTSRLLSEDGLCNDPRSCGDKHVLVVEKGACRLWESFFSYNLSGQWYTMSTAAWDLKSLALRPHDWSSADAAGLPMTPLLAKAAEANSGEIKHALRVNFRDAALAIETLWPARFAAGGDNPGAIPFGALLRLRSDFVIPDDWTVQAKALATAAKRYGLYVSDNGADFHVQGEPNAAWDLRTNAQMRGIKMSDMEFVDLRNVTSDPRFSRDSMAASW